uniref:Uncharacterized protein n=1 Tax=Moniliophthora roreri TaxID=221103 RepID=A0A0W0FWQ5_MONRR
MPIDLNKAPLFAFIGNARNKFPSTIRAIAVLRKLGKPPVSADLTRPTSKIETALDVFEYLTCMTTHATPLAQDRNQTAICIQKQWSPCIRPWVLFFLDRIARTPEILENPQGTTFVDNLVTATAFVIMYPASLEDPFPELDQLRTSQSLMTLSIEVWLRVVEIHHFSWYTWTELLVKMLFPKYIGQSFTQAFPHALAASRRKDDFELVCIRHLNRLSQRPWEIPDDELNGYTLSMTLFCQCFFPTSPSYFPFLQAGATPAITSALISLLSRTKTLENVSPGTERFNIVVDLAEKLLMLLRLLVEAPVYVFQTLDLGILVAFFKAERFHHLKMKITFPPPPFFKEGSQSTFDGLLSNLMEQFAILLLGGIRRQEMDIEERVDLTEIFSLDGEQRLSFATPDIPRVAIFRAR